MSQTSQPRVPHAWQARRVPASMRADAAATLVGPEAGDPVAAGRRFVQAAPTFGIDLDLLFATIDPARTPPIGQVALAVLGAGRTAMMFVSGEDRVADDHLERVSVIEHACAELSALGSNRPRIAQSLPEPDQGHVVNGLLAAGFFSVGELAYLRRPLSREDRALDLPQLPPGVSIRTVQSLEPGDPDRGALAAALKQSYEDTLDCPELCGMRDVEDVIESHKATGEWRADLWWLIEEHAVVRGCMLLNHSPDQSAVELVYLGVAPALRGRGLGRALLKQAIPPTARTGAAHLNCAVDRRNAPALRVYESLGFREFSARHALVRPL